MKFLGELNLTFNDYGVILGTNGDTPIMDAKAFGDVATVQRIAKAAEPLQSIHEKLRRRLLLKSLVRVQNAGRGNIRWGF